MNDTKMNTQLGTKWFTFYTKVRPWLACVTALGTIADFAQYKEIYLSHWWLMIYFFVAMAQPVLCIMVFIKSYEDYGDFVRFVKGVLVYETFSWPYMCATQEYLKNGLYVGPAIIMFAIAYAFTFLIWYRLNVKYFEKRVMTVPVCNADVAAEDANKIFFCCNCGEKLLGNERFCKRCGMKIEGAKVSTHIDIQPKPVAKKPKTQEKPKAKKQKKPANKKLVICLTVIPAALVVVALLVAFLLVPALKYNHAKSLLEDEKFELAYSAFEELDGFSDSEEMLLECRYVQAIKYRDAGEYDIANRIFWELGDYRDSELLIHEHDYHVVSHVEATCTADGSETFTCSGCEDSYTNYLKASHQYTETKVTDATCTAAGSKQYECSLCHDTYTETIEKKSHNYSSATCTKPKTCASCGKTEGSALGHTTDEAKCSRCGTVTFKTLTYSGVGSKVIDCSLPNGKFKITVTMTSGEGSVDVKAHYTASYGETYEWFFVIDAGNSEVNYINGPSPCTLVVNASDSTFGDSGWKITIEAA